MRKTVLYRYARPTEYKVKSGKKTCKLSSLLNLQSLEVNNQFENFLKDLINKLESNLKAEDISAEQVTVNFDEINYLIESSRHRIIDLENYLSHCKGKGGQIAGFLDLTTDKINWSFNREYLAESSDNCELNRKFIMFLDEGKKGFMENTIIQNGNTIITKEIMVDLDTKVIPKENVLQYFRGGLLMGEYENRSEINMVGDCSLKGYEIDISLDKESAILFKKNKLQIKLEEAECEYEKVKENLELFPNTFNRNKESETKRLIFSLKREIRNVRSDKEICKSDVLYVVLSILKYTNFNFL